MCVLWCLQVESYPLDMSYHCNQLWYGDKHGFLNLIDATLGNFELVQVFKIHFSLLLLI